MDTSGDCCHRSTTAADAVYKINFSKASLRTFQGHRHAFMRFLRLLT